MSNIDIFRKVQKASAELNLLSESKINDILRDLADAAESNSAEILAANEKDLAKMDPANPMYDRLKLTKERIDGIASDIRNVATLATWENIKGEHTVKRSENQTCEGAIRCDWNDL